MGVLGGLVVVIVGKVLLDALGESIGKVIESNEKDKTYRRLRRCRRWRERGEPQLFDFLEDLQDSNQQGDENGDS